MDAVSYVSGLVVSLIIGTLLYKQLEKKINLKQEVNLKAYGFAMGLIMPVLFAIIAESTIMKNKNLTDVTKKELHNGFLPGIIIQIVIVLALRLL